jgi:hypothetical protein
VSIDTNFSGAESSLDVSEKRRKPSHRGDSTIPQYRERISDALVRAFGCRDVFYEVLRR